MGHPTVPSGRSSKWWGLGGETMNLKERIAAAKAEFETAEPAVVDVEFGGEITLLGFLPISGTAWADLTAAHPSRQGAIQDGNLGYNLDAVLADYPLERITADGEPVSAADWAGIVSVLASPHIKRASSVLWGLHQMGPAQRLKELGKASAGALKRKPNSPAK